MKYPRVLIVGQYFETRTGGGITLTNLFKGWDKDCVAVISYNNSNPDLTLCERYFELREKEIKIKFPFNIKKNRSPKGITAEIESFYNKPRVKTTVEVTTKSRLIERIISSTGLLHRRRRFIISPELDRWITNFSPDIIYSQLSSLEIICFIKELDSKYEKPLAFHIMDDWPTTIVTKQLPIIRHYWKKIITKKTIQLFTKAKVLMSISESMSEEYSKRYGLQFLPFHNPIDIENWIPYSKYDYAINNNFRLLYAGRIGTALSTSLIEIANAIEQLIAQGYRIELNIQATCNHPIITELQKYSFVIIRDLSLYEELPQVFSDYDLLLLPNDFDDDAVKFLKYSMPTKASEYMISGAPILVYASEETHIAKHALKNGWALVVSENKTESLVFGIRLLIEDEKLRSQLGETAKRLARKYYDSKAIREDFRNVLITATDMN